MATFVLVTVTYSDLLLLLCTCICSVWSWCTLFFELVHIWYTCLLKFSHCSPILEAPIWQTILNHYLSAHPWLLSRYSLELIYEEMSYINDLWQCFVNKWIQILSCPWCKALGAGSWNWNRMYMYTVYYYIQPVVKSALWQMGRNG